MNFTFIQSGVDEPQGFPSSTPPVVACTAEFAVLRLHGHNAETWEKPNSTAAERFRYLYSEDEIAAGSGRCERWPNRPPTCTC